MTTIRKLFLVAPTALLFCLAACNTRGAVVSSTHHALTASSVEIAEDGTATVTFDDGNVVTVTPHSAAAAGAEENAVDMTAVSSDGTTATLESYEWVPIVRYGDQAGALFMEGSAALELAKWQGRGNSAALGIVALVLQDTATVAGVTDLNTLVDPYDAPDGPQAKAPKIRPQQAARCEAGMVNAPEVFDFPPEECQPQPGDAALVAVAQSGWYPCVRDAILALISGLGAYWLCGACVTFLYTVIPGILGYATNPLGWAGLLLGSAACVGCGISAYGLFTSTRDTIINCYYAFNPPGNPPAP